jgi:DNA modification methylase
VGEEIMKVKNQTITDSYSLYNADCVKAIKGIPDESIHVSIYSPPFAQLYSYSDSNEDMGNCKTYEEFFEHYDFLVKELHRILMPGRNVCVHCMDLPLFKSKDGDIGLRDFPGDLIRSHIKAGFTYHSRVCVWKDPLIAATRTHAIGLAHKQIVKDSTMCRTGIADTILVFRKNGDDKGAIPVTHPKGLTTYAGTKKVPTELVRKYTNWKDQGTNKLSHWIWQQYASPVWGDIDQTNVLPYKEGKEEDDERHLCPLQLQVIERCLVLYSNPNEVLFTPFLGCGSEAYQAVKMDRKAIGIELKTSYYRLALRNLESLKNLKNQRKLFDE